MYIRNCAKYAAPLMEALKGMYRFEDVQGGPKRDGNNLVRKTRKSVKLIPRRAEIKWTPEMEWGFRQIKDSLVDKIELYLPRPYARWRLSTDASDYSVRRVLEEEQDDGNWHPVAFLSRKLQGSTAEDAALPFRGGHLQSRPARLTVHCPAQPLEGTWPSPLHFSGHSVPLALAQAVAQPPFRPLRQVQGHRPSRHILVPPAFPSLPAYLAGGL